MSKIKTGMMAALIAIGLIACGNAPSQSKKERACPPGQTMTGIVTQTQYASGATESANGYCGVDAGCTDGKSDSVATESKTQVDCSEGSPLDAVCLLCPGQTAPDASYCKGAAPGLPGFLVSGRCSIDLCGYGACGSGTVCDNNALGPKCVAKGGNTTPTCATTGFTCGIGQACSDAGNMPHCVANCEDPKLSCPNGQRKQVRTGSNVCQCVIDAPVDTDGDSVLDADDSCPTTPGPVANLGCPAPTCTAKKRLDTSSAPWTCGGDGTYSAVCGKNHDAACVALTSCNGTTSKKCGGSGQVGAICGNAIDLTCVAGTTCVSGTCQTTTPATCASSGMSCAVGSLCSDSGGTPHCEANCSDARLPATCPAGQTKKISGALCACVPDSSGTCSDTNPCASGNTCVAGACTPWPTDCGTCPANSYCDWVTPGSGSGPVACRPIQPVKVKNLCASLMMEWGYTPAPVGFTGERKTFATGESMTGGTSVWANPVRKVDGVDTWQEAKAADCSCWSATGAKGRPVRCTINGTPSLVWNWRDGENL